MPVEAVKKARELNGLTSDRHGHVPDNVMRGLGDLNFYLPADSYGMAESGHAVVLHHIVDIFSERNG